MCQKLLTVLLLAVLSLSGCGDGETKLNLNPFSGSAAPEEGYKILPQPLPSTLYVNGAVQLQIKANVGDGIDEDILSLVRCFSEDTSVLEVDPNQSCLLRGVSPGKARVKVWIWPPNLVEKYSPNFIKVEISVSPNYVTELVISGSKIYINSSQKLSLSALLSNGKTVVDASNIARCLPVTSGNGIVVVTEDCTVTAGSEIGSVNVIAELIRPQTEPVPLSEFALTVLPEFVSDTAPFSIPLSGIGEFEFYYRFSTDVYSSYKVMMVADEVLIESLANKILLTVVPTSTEHPSSTPCINELAVGNQTVACGIDTTGTEGFIDVYLDGSIDTPSANFLGRLELTEDRDILMNDNQGIDIPESIDDYTLVQVGASYEGHVSSNRMSSSANESRYRTDVNNYLLQSASSYQVIVTFQADADGAYHFDANNVKVGWLFDDAKAKPIKYSDAAACVVQGENAVVCNIVGGKDSLFVFVYGNGDEYGANEYNASPATADGELSYSVLINNIQ